MVRITNGQATLVVPTSAFRDVYSRNGFHVCESVEGPEIIPEVKHVETHVNESEVAGEEVKDDSLDDDKQVTGLTEDDGEETTQEDAEEEATMSEDDKFLDELFAKPTEQWTKKEIKRAARIKNIDLSGTSSIQEARELMKSELLG